MNSKILIFLAVFGLALYANAQQAEDPSCPPEHAAMGHCTPKKAPAEDPSCPKEHADMGHCVPKVPTEGEPVSENFISAHLSQFFAFSDGTGPRGRSSFTAPNMFMLTMQKNGFKMDFMGTTDKWTVGAKGTAQLFQSGDGVIDSQHAHASPVMGWKISKIFKLNKEGSNTMVLCFAPRGEATAGPTTFMHRPSATGNVDAPLGHHLQDFFHVTSTVICTEFKTKKLTLEASAFSSAEPPTTQVNLNMHTPDSWGFRANYQLNNSISFGGSFANLKAHSHESEVSESGHEDHVHEGSDIITNPEITADIHESTKKRATAVAAWLSTSHKMGPGTLNNTIIWGQISHDETLNSGLEEFSYAFDKNNAYFRAEVLERTPGQLEVRIHGKSTVKAFTIGYEREMFSANNMKAYVGGAFTQHSIPSKLAAAYGSQAPRSLRVQTRIVWGATRALK